MISKAAEAQVQRVLAGKSALRSGSMSPPRQSLLPWQEWSKKASGGRKATYPAYL
jgi:hypothetical protein